ncbi:MAG: porin family protein [Deferribacteraceae bacterium]|jgi:hypothetical protein|nr:porin family protein [Deferribacteraceae bacterium]
MKRIIMVIVLSLFTVSVCHAQFRLNNYLGLELGFFQPTESAVSTYWGNYTNNMGYDIGVKYTNYFSENIGIVVRLSVITWDTAEENVYYSIGGAVFGPYASHFEFNTVSTAAGLALRFPVSEIIDITAHLGVSYNANSITYKEDFISDTTDSGSAFGFFIDAGCRYYITDRLATGATVRYATNSQGLSNRDNIEMGGTSVLLDLGLLF